MNDITKVKNLLSSDINLVSTAAEQALEYKQLYDEGKISETEFNDLILDITRLEVIDRELYTHQIFTKIDQAFRVIRYVMMTIPI